MHIAREAKLGEVDAAGEWWVMGHPRSREKERPVRPGGGSADAQTVFVVIGENTDCLHATATRHRVHVGRGQISRGACVVPELIAVARRRLDRAPTAAACRRLTTANVTRLSTLPRRAPAATSVSQCA